MNHYLFDAYGTLFDVHSAVAGLFGDASDEAQRFSSTWRAKQLEYAWVLTLMDDYADFWSLTEQALDYALAVTPTVDRSLRPALLDAYRKLGCFPEVRDVLQQMALSNARLAVLSNGSPDMLEAAIRSAGLQEILEHCFSVDAVRRFKTHRDAYAMYRREWSLEPADISFVSSNRWDIAGASRYGFRTIWINRHGVPDEYPDQAPALMLDSLRPLIDDCRGTASC